MAKRTITSTMKRYLKTGGIYPQSAVRIEMIDGQAWVVDNEDGYALKLFVSKGHAKDAIDRAAKPL